MSTIEGAKGPMDSAAILESVAKVREAWPMILQRLSEEVGTPEGARKLRVWLGTDKVQPAGMQVDRLIIDCPTTLFVMQIRDHFAPLLAKVAASCLDRPVSGVECRVAGPAFRQHRARLAEAGQRAASAAEEDDAAASADEASNRRGKLRRPFGHGFKVLSQFVVGTSNRHAYDAVSRLVEDSSHPGNPLFIHGSSGLGKTHLEQGLAVAFKERYPHSNVLYMTCEQFRNAYISACEARTAGLQAFRFKLRHADLLLIDDIHFLSRGQMVQTKEELFWTINELISKGKLVVITSDAHPSDIRYLEDRFVQRFTGGLVVPLYPPDTQVRREVVQMRAHQRGLVLPPEVINFVADYITDNVRELEGAVNRMLAFAASLDRKVDLQLARAALEDVLRRDATEPRLRVILRAVADHFDLAVEDIMSRSRSGARSTARHVAMYLFKLSGADTYGEVADAFGIRSHSSVSYACEQAAKIRACDPDLARFIDDLLLRVRNNNS